jgi:hypothetical protein
MVTVERLATSIERIYFAECRVERSRLSSSTYLYVFATDGSGNADSEATCSIRFGSHDAKPWNPGHNMDLDSRDAGNNAKARAYIERLGIKRRPTAMLRSATSQRAALTVAQRKYRAARTEALRTAHGIANLAPELRAAAMLFDNASTEDLMAATNLLRG